MFLALFHLSSGIFVLQVLIDTDHCYCVILNADGGAAFPSEKTARDCSSSDISSLKINTGSGKTEKTKIISSGQSDAITRARPILSAMSEKLYVFEGALGAGRVFKNHVPQLLRDNQTKHLLNTFVQNLLVWWILLCHDAVLR